MDETDWSTYNEPVVKESDEDLLRLINGGATVGSNIYCQSKWKLKIKRAQEQASSHIHGNKTTQLLHLLLDAYKQSPVDSYLHRTKLLDELKVPENELYRIGREVIDRGLVEPSDTVNGHFIVRLKITTEGIDFIRGIPGDDVKSLLLLLQQTQREQPTLLYISKSELLRRLGWTEQHLHFVGSYIINKGYAEQPQVLSLIPALKITRAGIEFLDSEKRPALSLDPPIEIQESLARFIHDYPDSNKVAFIMTKFGKTKAHNEIVKAIKNVLNSYGITGVKADDKQYHDDLFYNVMTYLHGCGFGISVFERIEAEEFNPNVSLEVGYMLALKKPVCLLKDKTLKILHTDLVGKLYKTFDPQDPSKTIPGEVFQWLLDKGIVSKKTEV